MQNSSTSELTPLAHWICTGPSHFAAAKAMLDEKHANPAANYDCPGVISGRIGAVKVAVAFIPRSMRLTDIASSVRSVTTSIATLKSVLVTSTIGSLDSPNNAPRDLIIDAPLNTDEHSSKTLPRYGRPSQHVAILQEEVGQDGRWLLGNLPSALLRLPDLQSSTQPPNSQQAKYPRLSYEAVRIGRQEPREGTISGESAQHLNIITERQAAELLSEIPLIFFFPALAYLTTDVVTVLAIDGNGSSDDGSEYAAASAASYARELIRSMSEGLINSIENLQGTESLVAPSTNMEVPFIGLQQLSRHGGAVLLVIPTANRAKGKLLLDGVKRQKPRGVTMHSITIPFDSGVGEQPYNEAGVLGAHNRIGNAVRHLHASDMEEMMVSSGVGTVLIASVENFMQTDNARRPTDFGVVVIHNACTGEIAATMSWGVTAPLANVDHARRFGFDGNRNYGRVTVGTVLNVKTMIFR